MILPIFIFIVFLSSNTLSSLEFDFFNTKYFKQILGFFQ